MRRMTDGAVTMVVFLVALTAAVRPGLAQGGRRGGAGTPKVAFSDAAVAEAIRKGVEFLKTARQADGSFGPYGQGKYPVGPTAMAAYAMLESGQVRYDDADMKKTLDFLVKWQAPGALASVKVANVNESYRKSWSRFCQKTYSLGLRANAFLAAAKQGGRQYRMHLRRDAELLIKSTKDGSYNYDCFGQGRSSGDNSNSQYGVLGVWAAAQLDEEVPRQYWYMVLKHWLECINADGGWTYRTGASTPTMTTAGLATLFVCYDNLLADGFVKCDQGPKVQAVLKPLTRALEWMDRYYQRAGGHVSAGAGHGGRGYYLLYGIERIGLASGYKYFGKADWYKLGATWLVNAQRPDGSWPGGYGPVISTSYALLFLVRGRHAVLFNKLVFPGDWNNRPRDVASLARWTSRQFETTVNWQIVNLQVPPEEWHDAPILYISGSTAPKFTDRQLEALRTYVHQGGTILSCTECEGDGFSKGIRAVYAKLFSDYRLVECPKDHALYSINFRLEGFPEFHIVTNGIRPLVIHTDKDLPRAWQLRLVQSDKPSFQAAVNVAMYVSGKALAEKALAARGTRGWPREVEFQPARTVKVARLQYNNQEGKPGNFNPEPLAWQRFSRLMASQAKTKVDVAGPMPIAQLAGSGAKVAAIGGTDRIALSAEEVKALQQFVAGGGLLLLEAAGGAWSTGGAKGFAETAEALAARIAAGLPDGLVRSRRLRRLTISSPLFQQPGAEIQKVRFRRFSRIEVRMKDTQPRLKALLDAKGNPLILLSEEDLTAGLVGYECYEVHGYAPASAFELMRNIVLWKAQKVAGRKTKPAGRRTTGKGRR